MNKKYIKMDQRWCKFFQIYVTLFSKILFNLVNLSNINRSLAIKLKKYAFCKRMLITKLLILTLKWLAHIFQFIPCSIFFSVLFYKDLWENLSSISKFAYLKICARQFLKNRIQTVSENLEYQILAVSYCTSQLHATKLS